MLDAEIKDALSMDPGPHYDFPKLERPFEARELQLAEGEAILGNSVAFER